MSGYVVRPVEAEPWDGFARLAERHNGIFEHVPSKGTGSRVMRRTV